MDMFIMFTSITLLWFATASTTAEGGEKIPACMIIDDGAPFFNMRWINDKTVCKEIPTD